MSSFRLEGTLTRPSFYLEPMDTALAIGKAVGSFLMFGPMGLAASMISGTKGADGACVANLDTFTKKIEIRGKSAE
jgi:hypothetical protein